MPDEIEFLVDKNDDWFNLEEVKEVDPAKGEEVDKKDYWGEIIGEPKPKKAVPRLKPLEFKVARGKQAGIVDQIKDAEIYYSGSLGRGIDPYCKPILTKEQELESNLIRIDLDKAASTLASLELKFSEGVLPVDGHPEHEKYLEVYDKYYDILFKSKS